MSTAFAKMQGASSGISGPVPVIRQSGSSRRTCQAFAARKNDSALRLQPRQRTARQEALAVLYTLLLPADIRLDRARQRRCVAAKAAAIPAEHAALTAQASQEVIDAKSAVLLDILTSGDRVEAKLAEHASEVDSVMLGLLQRRIQAAVRSDEEAKHIEGLHMLYRRLRLILDRQIAKPTELLLDDLLNRMGQPDWSDSEEQQQEVMECMRLAFGLPEEELNILGLASDISNDDDSTRSDVQMGSSVDDDLPIVSIPEFAKDSRELLKGALRDCVELRKALESRRYQDKARILEQTLNERMLLAKQVEELIRLADHVTTGLSALDVQAHADEDRDEDA